MCKDFTKRSIFYKYFTKYFSLGRGARQGDPISVFSFTLALEILFILIKSKYEIE